MTTHESRVIFDLGTHILALPQRCEVGDVLWFGEPRNLEAECIRVEPDGAPYCRVTDDFLPRRGMLAADWGWPGLNGPTTGLVGEPEEIAA